MVRAAAVQLSQAGQKWGEAKMNHKGTHIAIVYHSPSVAFVVSVLIQLFLCYGIAKPRHGGLLYLGEEARESEVALFVRQRVASSVGVGVKGPVRGCKIRNVFYGLPAGLIIGIARRIRSIVAPERRWGRFVVIKEVSEGVDGDEEGDEDDGGDA